MSQSLNPRRDAPLSGSTADLLEAFARQTDAMTDLRTAILRGLPGGFQFEVKRLDDGTAQLSIVDIKRDTRLVLGVW